MRKSVFGILTLAALAVSSVAIDSAVARDHDAGGGRSSGAPAVSGGGAPSPSISRSGSVRSLGGSPSSSSPPGNHNVRSFSGTRSFSGGPTNFDRHNRRHRHDRDFAFGVFPFGYDDGYYSDYAYAYGDDCYQIRRVRMPYGWRLRRIDVCNYPY